MDLALLAVTALGFIGVFLMLPRERATVSRLGGLIGVLALGGLFLLLIRAGAEARVDDHLSFGTKLSQLRHGNGVRVAGTGKDDLEINSPAAPSFKISLAGARTIGDVITRINAAEDYLTHDLPPGGRRAVRAEISQDRHSLVLHGAAAVHAVNNSFAVTDLGLTGKGAPGATDSLPELTGTPLAIAGAGGPISIFFYVFAAIMVMGSAGVISHPRPVYAALYFVLVTLAGAALFVLLMAEFMAIVLIIVYAGAILVTYVFVLMLASQGSVEGKTEPPEYDRRASEPFWAVLVSFVLMGTILQVLYPPPVGTDSTVPVVASTVQPGNRSESMGLFRGNADQMMIDSQNPDDSVERPGNMQLLGLTLYGKYAITLELAGVLLTIALVGAVVIARKNVDYEDKFAGTGALPAE